MDLEVHLATVVILRFNDLSVGSSNQPEHPTKDAPFLLIKRRLRHCVIYHGLNPSIAADGQFGHATGPLDGGRQASSLLGPSLILLQGFTRQTRSLG